MIGQEEEEGIARPRDRKFSWRGASDHRVVRVGRTGTLCNTTHGFVCGRHESNYESGSGARNVGCAIGIKAVHMRAGGKAEVECRV